MSDVTTSEPSSDPSSDPSSEPSTFADYTLRPTNSGLGLRSEQSGLAGTGLGLTAKDLGISGLDPRLHSEPSPYQFGSNVSYSDLKALKAAGLGSLDVTGTQSVDQALAADTVHQYLNKSLDVPGVIGFAFGPLAGLASRFIGAFAAGKTDASGVPNLIAQILGPKIKEQTGVSVAPATLANVLSGSFDSSAITNTAIANVAAKMGVPGSAIPALLKGDYGSAAANAASSALVGQIAGSFGPARGLVSSLINEIPALKSFKGDLSQTINSALTDTTGAFSTLADASTSALSNAFASGAPAATGTDTATKTGIASQAGAPKETAQDVAQAPKGNLNLAPLLGLAALSEAKTAKEKAEQAEQQAKTQQQRRPVELFSGDIFAGRRDDQVQQFAAGGSTMYTRDDFESEEEWLNYLAYQQQQEDDAQSNYFSGDNYADQLNSSASDSGDGAWWSAGDYVDPATVPPEDKAKVNDLLSRLGGEAKKLFYKKDENGNDTLNWTALAALFGGAYGLATGGKQDLRNVGFTGTVQHRSAGQAQIPYQYDDQRRPGSGGRRYLSDVYYGDKGQQDLMNAKAIAQAQGLASLQTPMGQNRGSLVAPTGYTQAQINQALATELAARPGTTQQAMIDYATKQYGIRPDQVEKAYAALPTKLASGGIAGLARGGQSRDAKYLDGDTNGMADKIQTSIDGNQPALLSHGEFVVPADVVAALGGGNNKSGAKALYQMMDRIRQQAHGSKKQMRQVEPSKVLPS